MLSKWSQEFFPNNVECVSLPILVGIEHADGKLIQIEFGQLLLVLLILHYDGNDVRGMLIMDVFFVKFKGICCHFARQLVVLWVDSGVIQGILNIVVGMTRFGRLGVGIVRYS